jgi:BirA family biotin operon repressor/biotin-[acetyl-CoA-carboxylase] ligase
MSVLIKPQRPFFSADSLPLIAALATAKTLLKWGVRAGVRWPNDVVVDGRKIAGILVESRTKGNELTYATVGIGINANVDTDAIESIRASSTSLLTILDRVVNREELIVDILSNLEAMCESIGSTRENAAIDILETLDWSKGKHVIVRAVDRDVVGLFDGYASLTTARILTKNGSELVEAATILSVDYESDQIKRPQANKR